MLFDRDIVVFLRGVAGRRSDCRKPVVVQESRARAVPIAIEAFFERLETREGSLGELDCPRGCLWVVDRGVGLSLRSKVRNWL